MHSFVFAVLAAAFVTAAPTSSCTRSYTVVDGDTCDAISAANNVSSYQLMQVNSAAIAPDCSNLQINQVLCLGVTGSDCTATYTVVDGDVCQSVSDSQGIDLSTLMANNPNIDSACDNIYPGEVLCVAQQVMVDGSSGTVNAAPAPASDPATQADPSPSTPENDSPATTPDSTDPSPASATPTPASTDPSPASANPAPASTDPTPASTGADPAGPTPTDDSDPNDDDLPDCEDDEDDGQD